MSDRIGRVVVLGSLNLDLQVGVVRLPAPGETVSARSASTGPGGKGLNQAVAAVRGGASVELVGCVGDDDAGRRLLAMASTEGIGVGGVSLVAGASTGQALVLVDERGDNSIVVIGGANAAMDDRVDQVLARLADLRLTAADVVLAQAETSLAATASAFGHARDRGARTIVNLAPYRDPGAELLARTTVLVVNESEFAALVPAPTPATTAERVAAARAIGALGPEAVVVTLGAAGALAVGADRVEEIGGRPVEVVDTTGAGDGFVGALAAELALGAALDEALRHATVAASLVVQQHGAAAAMPTRTQVEGAISATGA